MLLKLYFFECWQVNWELGEQILMPLLFQDPSVNICIGSQSNDIVNALCYILGVKGIHLVLLSALLR